MKKLPAFLVFALAVSASYGQVFPAEKILSAFGIQTVKLDDFFSKRNFFLSNTSKANDTLVKSYSYRAEVKKNKPVDPVKRYLVSKECKEDLSLSYQTSSEEEFINLIEGIKTAGFYCNDQGNPAGKKLLFQHNDMTVTISSEIKDSTHLYILSFHQQVFPDSKDMYYADDLLHFTSHEYLEYYFGKENVKKDFYYFAGDELVNCSVLFINTARQVVFIWKDEINKCGIDNLLFGGQQRLKSSMQSGNFVAESNWVFKSGIRAGMTLYELRKLNENNFRFYGGRSAKTGIVLDSNTGKIDFKKQEVVLGCVNCTDGKFATSEIMDADEALADGKILFALSVALNPD